MRRTRTTATMRSFVVVCQTEVRKCEGVPMRLAIFGIGTLAVLSGLSMAFGDPGCAATMPCHLPPPYPAQPANRPIIVHLHREVKPFHHSCWHCAKAPRVPIVESVAVERVAPPLVRTELVVSREAMRLVPVMAEERSLRAAQPPAERDCARDERDNRSDARSADPRDGNRDADPRGSARSGEGAAAGDRVAELEHQMANLSKKMDHMVRYMEIQEELLKARLRQAQGQ